MTHSAGNKEGPSYSSDGTCVYFSWERANHDQIWKMPVEGGEAVQVTRSGGHLPQESMDGKILFYLKANQDRPTLSSLWMIPPGGGEERHILDGVVNGNFEVKEHGIYCVRRRAEAAGDLLYHDLTSGETRLLQPIEGEVQFGFTVAPDERWFLLTKGSWGHSNLMLVENFH